MVAAEDPTPDDTEDSFDDESNVVEFEPLPAPPAVVTASPSPTPTPISVPTPEPTSETASPVLPREIANTDGDGVSLRDGCYDDDRIEGGLPEGDAVTLLEYGRGECAEWQIVGYGSDGLTTWVRERYLASAEDETPAATPVVSCHPSYPTICVPPAPPLLSCADLAFSHFQVIGTDPHGFDRDQNGVGCES